MRSEAQDAVYDVLYLDEASRCSRLAGGLSRAEALETAREESRKRRSPRLFLRGSDSFPRSHAVVIIRSGPERSTDASAPQAPGPIP